MDFRRKRQKLLWKNQAEVDAKADDGQTPLHAAAMYGRTK